jgi:hypothetical protein
MMSSFRLQQQAHNTPPGARSGGKAALTWHSAQWRQHHTRPHSQQHVSMLSLRRRRAR